MTDSDEEFFRLSAEYLAEFNHLMREAFTNLGYMTESLNSDVIELERLYRL